MTTEMERILKDFLIKMQNDISATQALQGQSMTEQQQVLKDHASMLTQFQQKMALMASDLQTLMQRSKDLAELYNRLEPLLSKLELLLDNEI